MNGARLETPYVNTVRELSRKGFVNRFADAKQQETAGKLFDAHVDKYGGFTPEDSDVLTKLVLEGVQPETPPPAVAKEAPVTEVTETLKAETGNQVERTLSGLPKGLESYGGEGRNAFGAGRSLMPDAPDDGLQPYEDQFVLSDGPKFPPAPKVAENTGFFDEDLNYFNW